MFVYELCRHIFTHDETLSCENRINLPNYTNNHNADSTRKRQRTRASSSRTKFIKEYRRSSSSTELPNTQTAPHKAQLHCARMLPPRCHHGALGHEVAHTIHPNTLRHSTARCSTSVAHPTRVSQTSSSSLGATAHSHTAMFCFGRGGGEWAEGLRRWRRGSTCKKAAHKKRITGAGSSALGTKRRTHDQKLPRD